MYESFDFDDRHEKFSNLLIKGWRQCSQCGASIKNVISWREPSAFISSSVSRHRCYGRYHGCGRRCHCWLCLTPRQQHQLVSHFHFCHGKRNKIANSLYSLLRYLKTPESQSHFRSHHHTVKRSRQRRRRRQQRRRRRRPHERQRQQRWRQNVRALQDTRGFPRVN